MGNVMKAKFYLLWLIMSLPAPVFAGSDGIMFHCQIENGWVDLFLDIDGVTHYVHSKSNVIDLALDNHLNASFFKISSTMLIGGGEAHIKFTNGHYDYYIYDITADVGEAAISKSGIAVLNGGVVLDNQVCFNNANIRGEAYQRLPRFEQDFISFVYDEVRLYH